MKFSYKILLLVSSISIMLDWITKKIVVDQLALGESVPVIPGFFSFTHIHNTGAAFGILAQANPMWRDPFFLIFPSIMLAVLLFYYHKLKEHQSLECWSFALIIAGAIGNVLDRLRYGYVVDFLDFYYAQHHFPAFNIADSCICIGAGMLMLQQFLCSTPQGPSLSFRERV